MSPHPAFAALLVLPVLADPAVAANPFFSEWKTPFGVPPFAEIREEHFLPAFREGIAQHDREVAAIAGSVEAPTFANTIVSRVAALRAEKAQLLGYRTWADYGLEENMAKTPAGVYGLLAQVWKPALEVAKRERADLQALMAKDLPGEALQPWDWRYYATKCEPSKRRRRTAATSASSTWTTTRAPASEGAPG